MTADTGSSGSDGDIVISEGITSSSTGGRNLIHSEKGSLSSSDAILISSASSGFTGMVINAYLMIRLIISYHLPYQV